MSVLKECAVASAALFRATVSVRILYRSWRGDGEHKRARGVTNWRG